MNIAIIVAAGQGTRFGAEKPKQFVEIGGKPLLVHTLERFENCAAIDEIILVLSEVEIANFQKLSEEFNLKKLSKVIAGGETRAESVRNGTGAIDSSEAEIVAVHDGARPFVTCAEISQTVERAMETGAACLVAPVNDTIKQVNGGKIVGTIDRANLRRALTPQAFRFEILQKAFSAENFDASATDECFLVEKLGHEIAFIDGSAKNIKITTPEDWRLAEMIFKELSV